MKLPISYGSPDDYELINSTADLYTSHYEL